ncbi:hypothetical protein [Variovorax sp. EBFNA2]|uniref:restriction endonuclease subunit S n=1 Tax=Variovorax sp. EBFNA2 TaxID=3342097 RepID=UPI0029BFD5C7|nr:hypothetical protein [Variovorax boronicumulans]WPG36741.1 hypothetical protein RZE79_25140 [Variovorax boronicumulans]
MSAEQSSWELVKLGEVLRHVARPLTVKAGVTYREIGIRSHGKGLFHKAPVSGAALGDKRVFYVEPGDFVLNIVFAWEGAIGVASEGERGMIASHRFPCFRAVEGRVDLHYLERFFHTPAGLELLGRVSPGGAGRNRTLNRTSFLQQVIPLPPLRDQQRIVGEIESVHSLLDDALARRRRADAEVKALRFAFLNARIGLEPQPNWVPLTSVISGFEAGSSPQCEARPASADEWGVLKVGAVSFGTFDERQNKALPQGMVVDHRDEVCEGDFLVSRANTPELVGACCIVGDVRARLLLSDKTLRAKFRSSAPVSPAWLNWILKSPALRSQIERSASGTSPTMKNISKARILALLVPAHTEVEQRKLVSEVDELDKETEQLKRLQARTRTELDALLPAILNRAFAGAL